MITKGWQKIYGVGFMTVSSWRLVAVTLLLFTFLTGFKARAEVYYSLYWYGNPISYCSQEKCIPGDDDCLVNAYPCTQGDYIYRHTETREGFRSLYDPTDSRIVCGTTASLACAEEEMILALNMTSKPSSIKPADISAFPDSFRFYLPPGTVYAVATVYTPRDMKEGMVVRYQQQPDCEYSQYEWMSYYYDKVPWQSSSQVTLDTLKKGDVYLPTSSGHAQVLPAFARSKPMTESEAGWMYVHRLPFNGDLIYTVQVTIRVNREAYMKWFKGYTKWNKDGDPWSIDELPNSPAPAPSCSKTNLDACTTKAGCENAGAYWYDDICNADPVCGLDNLKDCATEEECTGSGYYWYDDACQSQPNCRADHPAGCETKAECESQSVNKYWYDGECHAALACTSTSLNKCVNEDECSSSGFYWVDGACQQDPPCGPHHLESCLEEECGPAGGEWVDGSCKGLSCASGNLSACTNYLSCGQQGGVWHDDLQTCTEPHCGPDELFSCLSDAECSDAGGVWDGHYCRGLSLAQGCSPSNLAACKDALHCGLNNGFWNGVACVSKSSGNNVPVTGTCDADHLAYCRTQSSCVDAGGNWNGLICSTSSGGGTPLPTGECRVGNLAGCTDENSCDHAGGYWYNDSCNRLKPAETSVSEPKKEDLVDYNDRRASAYVDLGPGAWDGEINAGEELDLSLDFPAAAGEKTRYAGIIVKDGGLVFLQNKGEEFLSEDVTPLQVNDFADLNQSLLPSPVDLCASFKAQIGYDYQGEWTVFFLTVDGNNADVVDLDGLEQALEESSYSLGYYTVKVDCTKVAPPSVAVAPAAALPALEGAEVQPSSTVVSVPGGSLALLQPRLTVAAGDVGKSANLFVRVFIKDGLTKVNEYTPVTPVVLSSEVDYGQYVPAAKVYFCLDDARNYYIYFGYEIPAENKIRFNGYEIKIQ